METEPVPRIEQRAGDAERERAGTERIAACAASLVLGLSTAGALPLLAPWLGRAALGLAVAASAALPLVPWVWVARNAKRRAPPASAGDASPAWRGGDWLVAAPISASVLVGLALYNAFHARLRVLNLSEQPFVVLVGEHRVGRVEPTSGESPEAGAELDAPAGDQTLTVVGADAGALVERRRVHFSSGSSYLYAPASLGYCFHIERRSYGATGDAERETEPLEGAARFWEVPPDVAWFSPNPDPGPFRTSGGSLLALRQERCAP